MAKAMIVSVGTGTRPDVNIVKPLVKTVQNSDHELTLFLVSDESQKYAEAVAQNAQLPETAFQCVRVRDPDNMQQCFRAALEALHNIRARGYNPENIVADYTFGTKAMTAGLALAAVSFRCGTLKYISGTRQNGVVVDGTEEFRSITPSAILAVSEIELARRLVLQLRFEAAKEILSRVNDALLTAHDRNLKDNLSLLATAYSRWDHFDHRTFCGEYSKVKWDNVPELSCFKVEKSIPSGRLIPLATALDNGETTLDALADLYDNALRRGFEGRFDDAVARLYRLTEMLAQYILWSECKIRTGDVQLTNEHVVAKLAPLVHEQLERYRDSSDGKVKIALNTSYWLLEKLGHPIGNKFTNTRKLGALLKQRNDSILAHGTKPVTREMWESLSQQVMELMTEVDKGFEARARELQFPWVLDKWEST